MEVKVLNKGCSAVNAHKYVIVNAFDCLSACLSVCMSVNEQDYSKSHGRILWKFLGKFGCLTSNSWLHFGSDPNHGADTGILRDFLQEFFYHHRANAVTGSAALSEVCDLRTVLHASIFLHKQHSSLCIVVPSPKLQEECSPWNQNESRRTFQIYSSCCCVSSWRFRTLPAVDSLQQSRVRHASHSLVLARVQWVAIFNNCTKQ